MFDLGPHAGFILASYIVTIVILAALIWQSVSRYKSAKQTLDRAQAAAPGGGDHG
jgi:heme exporter protein CcmD